MASCSLATDLPTPQFSSYNLNSSDSTAAASYLPHFVALPLIAMKTAKKSARGGQRKSRSVKDTVAKASKTPNSSPRSVKLEDAKPLVGNFSVGAATPQVDKTESAKGVVTSSLDEGTVPRPLNPPPKSRKRKRKGFAKDANEKEAGLVSQCEKKEAEDKASSGKTEEEINYVVGYEPKPKRRRLDSQGTTPALKKTTLKVCGNCGTAAEKSRAKKCHKCQKFFYDHWAQRCRIPPCPKCHYSRKARGCTMLPKICERCGHLLPGNEKLDNATSNYDSDGSSGNLDILKNEANDDKGVAGVGYLGEVVIQKVSQLVESSKAVDMHVTGAELEESKPLTGSNKVESASNQSHTEVDGVSNEDIPGVCIRGSSREATSTAVPCEVDGVSNESTPGGSSRETMSKVVHNEVGGVSNKSTPKEKGEGGRTEECQSNPGVIAVVISDSASNVSPPPQSSSAFLPLKSQNQVTSSADAAGSTNSEKASKSKDPSPSTTPKNETVPFPMPQQLITTPFVMASPECPHSAVIVNLEGLPSIGVNVEDLPPAVRVYSDDLPPQAVKVNSDDLPQISDMMSNIENATTVIASSSETLKRSLESPGDFAEMQDDDGDSQKKLDKYMYFTREFRKLYTQSETGGSVEASGGRPIEAAPPSIMESSATTEQRGDEEGHRNSDESGSLDRVDKESTHSEKKSKYQLIAPKPALASTAGFGSLMSMPISQILNQMHTPNQLNLSSLQPLLIPNKKVAVTPISVLNPAHLQGSLNMQMLAQQLPLSSTNPTDVNMNLTLASSLAAFMANKSTGLSSVSDSMASSLPQLTSSQASSVNSAPTSSNLVSSKSQPAPSQAASVSSTTTITTPTTTTTTTKAATTTKVMEVMSMMEKAKTNLAVIVCAVSKQASRSLSVVRTKQSGTVKSIASSDTVTTGMPPMVSPPVLVSIGTSVTSAGTSDLVCHGDASRGLPSSVSTLSYPPPPLRSIPERTVDNSVIKIQSGADDSIVKVRSGKVEANVGKMQSGTKNSAIKIQLARENDIPLSSNDFRVSASTQTSLGSVYKSPLGVNLTSIDEPPKIADKVPDLLPRASQCVRNPSVITTSAAAASLPPLTSSSEEVWTKSLVSNSNLAASFAHRLLVATISQNLTSSSSTIELPSHSSSCSSSGVTTSNHSLVRSRSKSPPSVVTSSSPASIFHKLDLSAASIHTGNKIRVSLLKQISDQQDSSVSSSSSTAAPAEAVLVDSSPRVTPPPVPPLSPISLMETTAGPSITTSNVPSTVMPTDLNSSSSSTSFGLPTTATGPLATKFQNFAVSPSLSVIATVETSKSKSTEGVKSLAKERPEYSGTVEEDDSSMAQLLSVSEMVDSVSECVTAIPNSVADYVMPSSFTSSNVIASTSSTPAFASLSSSSSLIGNLNAGDKMDTATIERLASKVQLRIKDALMLTGSISPEDTMETKLSASASALQAARQATGFRKILPSISKQQMGVSSAPVSFSHGRTPGVVTVQVCSSIPASLTLSSITNSSTTSAQGPRVSGSSSWGSVGNGSGDGDSGVGADGAGVDATVGMVQDPLSKKSSFPGIVKPRSVVAGGGNVMVTPLSPTMLPIVRTVAQIVTSSSLKSKVQKVYRIVYITRQYCCFLSILTLPPLIL